ncbi:MAG: hypothetical protein AAGN82_21575 [Myxococcota bacterium]
MNASASFSCFFTATLLVGTLVAAPAAGQPAEEPPPGAAAPPVDDVPPGAAAPPPPPSDPPAAVAPAPRPSAPPPAPAAGYAPPPTGYGAPAPPVPNPDAAMRSAPPEPLPDFIPNYEDGDPIPPGYKVQSKVRKDLVVAGSVVLGSAWLISVLSAAIAQTVDEVDEQTGEVLNDTGPNDWIPLYIPVVGPFITIGTVGASGGGVGILLLDGVVQSGGLAMLIAGIALPKKALVKTYGDVELTIAPQVGMGHQSLGLHGRF